jgi:hypothetical protein
MRSGIFCSPAARFGARRLWTRQGGRSAVSESFDELTRALGTGVSRRRALKIFFAAAASSALGLQFRSVRAQAATCGPGVGMCTNGKCCSAPGTHCCPGDVHCCFNSGPLSRCCGLEVCCGEGDVCCPNATGNGVANGGLCCPAGSTCCGNVCCPPGQACQSGTCGGCPAGLVACNGTCCLAGQVCLTDTFGSQVCCEPGQAACGKICCSAGTQCVDPATFTCSGCPSGQFDCTGKCVDLLTDSNNCGSCGKVCTSGQCCGGQCCSNTCCGATCCAPSDKCCNGMCASPQALADGLAACIGDVTTQYNQEIGLCNKQVPAVRVGCVISTTAVLEAQLARCRRQFCQ